MLMSAICTNETTDSIENTDIDKVNIVSTIQFQNASFVSCIKLAIALLLVCSYPLNDITLYMPISSTQACMTRAPEFHVTF